MQIRALNFSLFLLIWQASGQSLVEISDILVLSDSTTNNQVQSYTLYPFPYIEGVRFPPHLLV